MINEALKVAYFPLARVVHAGQTTDLVLPDPMKWRYVYCLLQLIWKDNLIQTVAFLPFFGSIYCSPICISELHVFTFLYSRLQQHSLYRDDPHFHTAAM